MESCQVAIVGSGFAGTILARILHRLGSKVVLVERHRHPRFAIGESSTPLAAICLERLARAYEMPLISSWLAAYGRVDGAHAGGAAGSEAGIHLLPVTVPVSSLLRLLPENEHRLLVAASPDDAVADSHWLRQDVDHHLVRRAVGEGVDYRDQTEIQNLRQNR